MRATVENLEKAAVEQQCRILHLPTVAEQCAPLAEVAVKQRQTYMRYLEALLAAELEERERNTITRRIKDARLPRIKTLEQFDFTKAPQINASEIHELAQGGYIERAEPVILIGDCGTGKTHLLTGLCVAACRQKRLIPRGLTPLRTRGSSTRRLGSPKMRPRELLLVRSHANSSQITSLRTTAYCKSSRAMQWTGRV
jgi:DNA replication protein DnaC